MPSPEAETLKQRIRSFVNDVATLDVLTLTGDVSLIKAAAAPTAEKPKELNWDKLFADIVNNMKTADDSKLEVVAYTHAEWDMDSVNFVRKELSEGDKDMVVAHHASVEAAQKSRFEAVKIVAGILGVRF